MRGADAETIVRVRATLRTIFRRRSDLRPLRLFVDFRFVAAKSAADYAELRRQNQDGTADYANLEKRN